MEDFFTKAENNSLATVAVLGSKIKKNYLVIMTPSEKLLKFMASDLK